MDTLESNKLIAVFDGAENLANENEWYRLPNKAAVRAKELEYHTDWDWLMPVVEKIEAIELDNFTCKFDIINRNEVEISAGDTPVFYSGFNTNSKLTSVWVGVVNFIQWYNTHHPLKTAK